MQFGDVVALFLVVAFILLLPLVTRLLAKPQQRTLTIDAQGIHTTIGTQSGSIPWSNVVDLVHDADSIFYYRTNRKLVSDSQSHISNTGATTSLSRYNHRLSISTVNTIENAMPDNPINRARSAAAEQAHVADRLDRGDFSIQKQQKGFPDLSISSLPAGG